MSSTFSTITGSGELSGDEHRDTPGFAGLSRTLRVLGAELGPSRQRWRRSARIALITGFGAAVTAAVQVANPLGLTLLFNFAAPEMAVDFAAAFRFLAGAAILQVIGIALAGAMADSAIPHLAIFAALSLLSGYLIYANPRVGRLWIWVQVPVLTAFYLVLFDPVGFGWNDEEAFAGVAIAVAILYAANTLLWPQPADAVLGESLAETLERSRRRLAALLDICAERGGLRPADDRPVASKLGYHVTLLGPAAHHSKAVEVPAALLAAVMVAERIHNEIERIAELAASYAPFEIGEEAKAELNAAGAELDAMLSGYLAGLAGAHRQAGAWQAGVSPPATPLGLPAATATVAPPAALRSRLDRLSRHLGGAAGDAGRPAQMLLARLQALCSLLAIDRAEQPQPTGTRVAQDSLAPPAPRSPLPLAPADASFPSPLPQSVGGEGGGEGADTLQQSSGSVSERPAQESLPLSVAPQRPKLNRFLLRYTVRHTIAMVLAFVCGLFCNNAAMHAALWLLMIGGPPSHGATVRKFTIRAIGAALALVLAALGTILLAPNSTTVFSYAMALSAGALVMAYIGQGGGLLSYLSIGGTAFVIAFSGPGPRTDAFGSIWTIWGISFGMLIRAAVSIVWRERASRTLVEQFQAPLEAIFQILSPAPGKHGDAVPIHNAEAALIGGIREMLAIANDAQLEGRSAGIDSTNLVDALDTMRRIGFILGNRALRGADRDESFDAALLARFADWLESLAVQDLEGSPSLTPLRDMVVHCTAPSLDRWAGAQGETGQVVGLVRALEGQLKTVSLY